MEFSKVRDVFDYHCRHLKIDRDIVRKLERYKIEFISKNEQHISFFGSNLIGCYAVRFTQGDRDKIFHDLLKIDEKDVDKELDKIIPKKKFNVAGDNANLALIWLCHAIYRSTIDDKDKENGMAICIEILQYKFFTSRLWRHWRYPCPVQEAEATLAALNNKFIIKQKGSWNNYFRSMALHFINPETSPHFETIKSMSKDLNFSSGSKSYDRNNTEKQCTAYMATDIQSRIRDMLKNIYDIWKNVHEKGKKITTQSKLSILEGEASFKDDFNRKTKLNQYIHSVASDRNSFIKSELVEIIVKALPTMPEHYFYRVLEYIPDNYKNAKISDLLDLIIEHAIKYLSVNNELSRNQNDIAYLLSKMKGTYSSSRSNDVMLMRVRKKTEDLVQIAANTKAPAFISATRTGVLLYILLRTFTISYYSS
nr:MAG TPA: hypothetical protein [Caudoviricetes sp.]